MKKQKIAVLTGAGVSAESGISTFRDANGLWDNYNVEDVATLEGWNRNPALVLDFSVKLCVLHCYICLICLILPKVVIFLPFAKCFAMFFELTTA